MGDLSLLPYSEEEKMDVRKELGYTESGMKEDVDAIMDWFKKQPHLVEAGIDPRFAEKILIMSKGSREKAKRRIDNYYKYRALSPDLIQSRREVLLSNNKDIWTFFRQALISKLFNGKRITVVQFTDPDPSSFCTEDLFRTLYMIGDLRAQYDYMIGEIWLVDLKNITLGHFLRLNPMVLQRAANLLQEGLSFKIFAIHVLNAPSIGLQIFNLFKKFVKAKIMERLMVHANLEELHQVLPKKYLPKDYGGEEPSMEEFRDLYQKEFKSGEIKQFLLDRCKQISDETKRPGADTNEEFLAGTFKKLDLD